MLRWGVMESVQAQFSKIAGEALARGMDREVEERFRLLALRMQLIELELELFLATGRIPSGPLP